MTGKAWTRRREKDPSPKIRHAVQLGFLLLNFWIGVQFYLFVRYFERGGFKVGRPPGVEGWLPIAGMMNTSYLLQTGRVPEIHPAAMVLFVAFLTISIVFQSFLWMALPRGDHLRAALEIRPENFSAGVLSCPLARRAAARNEIPVARAVRLGR